MTRHGEDDPPEAPSPGVAARDGYGRGVSPFRPDARRPLLQRLVPVSEQLPGYRGGVLRSFQADGIVFVFARVKDPIRRTLEAARIVELVGPDHLYPTVRAAVQAAPSAGEEQQE